MRRLTSTHWFRVGTASVSAAVVLTALFALAGASHITVTLQSALVHAAGMTALVSLTMPRLRGYFHRHPPAIRWGLRIVTLLALACVGTMLACGILTSLGLRPGEPFWTCFGHDLSICVLITLTLGISMALYDIQRRRLDAVTAALRERELDHERARTRFGARLAYSIDVQPEAAGCEVPPLAVQTLVENSIKHAIAPRPGGGRLRVEASASGEHILLSVWDDGPGFTGDAMRAGHGLDNLRARLAARFGAGASLEVGRRDGGTRVTVALPRARLA